MKNDTSTIDPRIEKCRERVAKKAIWSAGVSLIPIPGLDIAADVTTSMAGFVINAHTLAKTSLTVYYARSE